MEVKQDFKELLELFHSHGVDFVIVGAFALAYHGAPRYTGDLDILVRPDIENGRRILGALQDFGFASLGLKTDDFAVLDQIIQLGVPPIRVDILTSLTGVSWDEVASASERGKFGDVDVSYIGRREFVLNKRSIGRKKDLADLEAIGEQ
jgi:hypothetical protein